MTLFISCGQRPLALHSLSISIHCVPLALDEVIEIPRLNVIFINHLFSANWLHTYPIIKISEVSDAIEPMIWLSLQWDERTPSHWMGFTFHQKAVSYLRIAMPLVHYWKYPAWKIAIVCYTVHSWVRQLAGILLQTLALRIPAL